MNLRTFDNCTSAYGRRGKPIVNFSKQGMIRIGKTAAKMMELKVGDKIRFHQDRARANDWYLEKNNESGFPVRLSSNKSFVLNTAAVCNIIREQFKQGESFTVELGTEPVEGKYWSLLTSKLQEVK